MIELQTEWIDNTMTLLSGRPSLGIRSKSRRRKDPENRDPACAGPGGWRASISSREQHSECYAPPPAPFRLTALIALGVAGCWLLSSSLAQAQSCSDFPLYYDSAYPPFSSPGISPESAATLCPNQALSNNDIALTRARDGASRIHNRLQASREATRAGAIASRLVLGSAKLGMFGLFNYLPEQKEAVAIGPFSLLFNGHGTGFDRDPSAAERGYDGHSWGLELGTDYRLGERGVIGALLGYEVTNAEFDRDVASNFTPPPNAGKMNEKSLTFALFGSYNLSENFYLEGSLGYGASEHTLRRNGTHDTTIGPATNVVVEGDPNGREYWASLGAGYDAYRGATGYGTYLRVTYAHSRVDAYTEKDLNGSNRVMNIGEADTESLTAVIGVRASRAISLDWGVLVPHLRLEFEHEFQDDPQNIATSFVTGNSVGVFTLRGDAPDRSYFNLGTGLQFILPNGFIPFFELKALLGNRDLERYQLLMGLRTEF